MKYLIRTQEVTQRTYEFEADTYREAILELNNLLREETIWTRNPKLIPIEEFKIREQICRSKNKE